MTNLIANINGNGYLWIEGNFNYYDNENSTALTINKPSGINGVDISDYEAWVEVVRTFNNQTSRDFGQAVGNTYEITGNNPKGTVLTITIYFVNPLSENEVATNAVNIQFGINKATGSLPPGVLPETKILDKAFTNFIVIGKAIDFYNVGGQKVSGGNFNDLAGKAELEIFTRGATIKVAASNATAKSKAAADYVCDGVADDVEINAAIAELAGIGGSIELSEGDFLLDNKILINKNNIWLRGQGAATCVRRPSGSNAAIEVNPGTVGVCLSNIEVEGNNTTIITIFNKGKTILSNVLCLGGQQGITTSSTGSSVIIGCECINNAIVNITENGTNSIIMGNRCIGASISGINDQGTGTVVEGNVVIRKGDL